MRKSFVLKMDFLILVSAVMESWQRLKDEFDCVLIEGAGSPAEINLRDRDIANMGFAEAADVPVILVADIDRGGVFAHLVGTLDLLSASEQIRVIGFVINRFRGDIGLLESGLDWLEAIIEAHRSTTSEDWRSDVGRPAGELLATLWSRSTAAQRRADVVRFVVHGGAAPRILDSFPRSGPESSPHAQGLHP